MEPESISDVLFPFFEQTRGMHQISSMDRLNCHRCHRQMFLNRLKKRLLCHFLTNILYSTKIRKERIDPRQSWQNYIEAHFGIMRRIGDHRLNQATSWEEITQAHRRFVNDYNEQIHFAHQAHQDHRHSPKEALRGVLARTLPESLLAQILFTSQVTCHLDRSGYVRFRRWRLYAEAGLAKKLVTVHLSASTLRVEHKQTDLALYTVAWHEDRKHITDVANPRVIETRYRSPQLTLWALGPDERLLFKKLPDYAPRTQRKLIDVFQLPLPEILWQGPSSDELERDITSS